MVLPVSSLLLFRNFARANRRSSEEVGGSSVASEVDGHADVKVAVEHEVTGVNALIEHTVAGSDLGIGTPILGCWLHPKQKGLGAKRGREALRR